MKLYGNMKNNLIIIEDCNDLNLNFNLLFSVNFCFKVYERWINTINTKRIFEKGFKIKINVKN